MGRLPDDDQSQRALGVDSSNRAFCMFRRPVAGRGSQRRQRRRVEIRKRDIGQVRPAERAPLEALRAPQVQPHRAKSAESSKASEKDVADAGDSSPATIPASVANANAQLTSTDAPPTAPAR